MHYWHAAEPMCACGSALTAPNRPRHASEARLRLLGSAGPPPVSAIMCYVPAGLLPSLQPTCALAGICWMLGSSSKSSGPQCFPSCRRAADARLISCMCFLKACLQLPHQSLPCSYVLGGGSSSELARSTCGATGFQHRMPMQAELLAPPPTLRSYVMGGGNSSEWLGDCLRLNLHTGRWEQVGRLGLAGFNGGSSCGAV